MTKKIATIALAVAAIAGSALATVAEAKPGHGHGGPYYRGYRYYGPVVPVYPLVSACEYPRSMWRRTGRYYWKVRYYDCMGW